MSNKIVIVGGGLAGLMCAIKATETPGTTVSSLEWELIFNLEMS